MSSAISLRPTRLRSTTQANIAKPCFGKRMALCIQASQHLRHGILGLGLKQTLCISMLAHALILTIQWIKPKPDTTIKAPLEVVLVNAKSQNTPQSPQALAQVALDGGGQADEGRATTTPEQFNDGIRQRELNAANHTQATTTQQELQAAQARLQTLEQLQNQLQQQSPLNTAPLSPSNQKNTNQTNNETNNLPNNDPTTQRALELQQLQAQIAQNIKTYNERPRKHFFSPRTSPYALAVYEESWRNRVEQIGNANYPEELKGQIYGKLRLTAYIKTNGELDHVEIDRSSGSTILDRAAIRLLRMAAPFDPLPKNTQNRVDVLAITRTWVFAKGAISTEP